MKKILFFFLTALFSIYSSQMLAKTVTITQDTPSQGTYEGAPVYVLLSTDKLTVKNGDIIWYVYTSTQTSAKSFTTSTQIDLSTLNADA